MKSIQEFCDKHVACQAGKEWALTNCKNMSDVWEKAKPEWLLWVATRPGVLPDRELRLFAVFCARQVEHLLTDQRSLDALTTAERFANGEATLGELAAAWDAACAAAWDAASDAANDAAWDAACAAAWDAACAAARVGASDAARVGASDAASAAARAAASAAAWYAASDAAWYATRAAARDAAMAAQCDWLRKNTNPNFGD